MENTVANTEYKAEDLQSMSVEQLRKIARIRKAQGEWKTAKGFGLKVAGMKRDLLVDMLVTGIFPKNENGETAPITDENDLAAIIAKAIENRINPAIDEDAIIDLIDLKIEEKTKDLKPTVTTIEVKNITTTDEKTINVGLQHASFTKVLKRLELGFNVLLVGPAGSGKTTLAESIAKALDLPFYIMPVGLQTTKSDLMGYNDANGKYVPTSLRKAYETGGIFLMDEIDAANGNVLTIINAALENNVCGFPDGMVKRHPDFRFIGAANTYGRGSDRVYVGRNPIDGATLERFNVIDFDYDETLETVLAGNTAWSDKVQKLRKVIFNLKEKIICSPRLSIKGAKMLSAGIPEEEIFDELLWRGINADIKNKIMAAFNAEA